MNIPKLSPDISIGNLLSITAVILAFTTSYINQTRDVKEINEDLAINQARLEKVIESQNILFKGIEDVASIERRIIVVETLADKNLDRLNNLTVLEVKIEERFSRYEEILNDQRIRNQEVVQVLNEVKDELRKRPSDINKSQGPTFAPNPTIAENVK